MTEERITRDKANAALREYNMDKVPWSVTYKILGPYFDQEPDDDAMWDEIDTLIAKLSEQNNTRHYVFRCPNTKLFGVEIGAGATTTNTMSPEYTLPQLRDKLREMVKPPVPTLDEVESLVMAWQRTNRIPTDEDVAIFARYLAALREKEKEDKEKEKN